MKLRYNKRGKQFFFLTLTVDGRRGLLSRLIDDSPRPPLLPLGEAVAAALRALHGLFPSVTASDRVIMPDHFHVVLIINYERDERKSLSPLWLAHRLIDALELWAARTGALAPEPPVDREVVPLTVETMAGFLGEAIRRASEAYCSGGAGALAPVPAVFSRDPWLDLSFDSRQLKAIRHYIRLNPARALWKTKNPDCFRRRAVKTAKLVTELGPLPDVFYAVGDVTILGSPFLRHVRLTMKKTAEEHQGEIDEIVEAAKRGVVPVSGFISAGEKALLRRLKAETNVRFVKTLPYALSSHYDPSAEDSREIAAHRLVIISTLADTEAISSKEMRFSRAAARSFRENCLQMNALAAALAQRTDSGVSPFS